MAAATRKSEESKFGKHLQTYRRKRDFSKTAEPSGDEGVNSTGHAFVVQKHAASHLHYDFRLEMGGVLKSWAVAKGPSVDPAVKRLAVEVEDHPLAYGRFEGVIPKGQYGGGTVMLWDRGTWHAKGDAHKDYEAGRLKFRLNGHKMKGQWALVRMKQRPTDRSPAWLLIKDRDAEAAPGHPDKLLKQDKSVKTGREMQDIATGEDVWQSDRKKSAAKSRAGVTKRALKSQPKPKVRAKTTRSVRGLAAIPQFIEPQLATRVDRPPETNGWLHEIKFDGYRLHARIEKPQATILTRHNVDWTAKFTKLAKALTGLGVDNAYIDGEAVVMDAAGVSDFGALQNWFKSPGHEAVTYYAFDLLFLNGQDLRELHLVSRKELLRELIEALSSADIRYSDHQMGDGTAFFNAAAGLGVEGIISKAADGVYVSGRSRGWLKVKQIERQEFVIGGYALSTTGRPAIGSLLLGEYHGKKLIYVGKVGTGYTAAVAKELFGRLSKLESQNSDFEHVPAMARRGVKWCKPKLVAEIEFGAWTKEHILRHASFVGLRADKRPQDVAEEKEMPIGKVTSPSGKRTSRRKAASDDSSEVLGVVITHPERLIYPREHLSKLDVARYYEAVANIMLPHVAERPLSLVRCPDGVGPSCFFQKHAGAGLPEAIRETRIGKGKNDSVLTISTPKGLVSLVQRGVLEVHIWGSHLAHVEQPDLVVFDFDPDPSIKWNAVVRAALDMRDMLKEMGLECFVKTTGGKGLHVVLPLMPALKWDGIKDFSKAVAQGFAARDPAAFILNMSKKLRKGRIFVDYLRNGRGATAVAPYATRARPGAPIATPISWQELKNGAEPLDFTIRTVPKRIAKGFKDPWRSLLISKQELTLGILEKLSAR